MPSSITTLVCALDSNVIIVAKSSNEIFFIVLLVWLFFLLLSKVMQTSKIAKLWLSKYAKMSENTFYNIH